MKKLLIIAVAAVSLMLVARPAAAQQDPEAELFAGYSFLLVNVEDGIDDDRGEAHGLQGSYTYFLDRRFGVTVAGSGHWGTIPAPPNIFGVAEFDHRLYTLLVGPSYQFHRGLTSGVGGQLLAGAAWRDLQTRVGGLDVADDTAFAASASLHLDLRLTDRIWLRAAEPALLYTRFDDDGQVDFRISAGIVLQAGELLQ